MNIYLSLYLTLAKISLGCFGGGYAILPLLQRVLVEEKQWLSAEDVSDIFALAQVTPGVIAVNAATFVGTKTAGARGALCATLGLLTPPILMVTLIAIFFWPYLQLPFMRHILAGLQVCVCALIAHTVVQLFHASVLDLPGFLIFLAALFVSFFTALSPAVLIVAGGLLGLGISRIRRKGETDR